MASVWSKPGADGKPLWYATIYIDGAARQFPLKESDGKTRVANRTRALKAAGKLESDLKQNKSKVQIKNKRQALFKTVWPLFMKDYVDTLAPIPKKTTSGRSRVISRRLASPGSALATSPTATSSTTSTRRRIQRGHRRSTRAPFLHR